MDRRSVLIGRSSRCYVPTPTVGQDDWDTHLAAVEFAYNTSQKASTGVTPFYLNYGQHPQVPAQLAASTLKAEAPNVPAAYDFLERIADGLEKTRANLQKAQSQQKATEDVHRRDFAFSVGDKVLLTTANLRMPARWSLASKYCGPLRITAVVTPVTYRLELPESMRRLNPSFYISQLKAYNEDDNDRFPGRPTDEPPPQDISPDGDEIFEVEQILDRELKNGEYRYKVEWKGYPGHDASWEPASMLKDAQDAIEDFNRVHRPSRRRGGVKNPVSSE